MAASLLFLGAICGLFGFLFAFLLGSIRGSAGNGHNLLGRRSYCHRYDGQRLDPCYFPSTVSEMVHKADDPTGKVFFFFEFTGALLIFFSFYPYRLRAIYIGDAHAMPVIGVSWVRFRQFVPAPGMMMLSVITTMPYEQADILDMFCILLHQVGAMLLFVGYFVAEAVTIGWGPFRQVKSVHHHGEGWCLRRWCLHFIVVFISLCLAFILVAHVLFGSQIYQFESISESCNSVFMILLGYLFDDVN